MQKNLPYAQRRMYSNWIVTVTNIIRFHQYRGILGEVCKSQASTEATTEIPRGTAATSLGYIYLEI